MTHLFFIHGSLSSGRMWRRYQSHFNGYSSSAPDLLGAGANRPVTFHTGWSLESELEALEAHFEGITQDITLIAHSYGGALALLLAARNPSRIRQVIAHEPLNFPILDTPEDRALLHSFGDHAYYLNEANAGKEAWVQGVVDFWSGPGTWEAMAPKHRRFALAMSSKAFFEVRFGISVGIQAEVLKAISCPIRMTVGVDAPPAEQRIVECLGEVLPNSIILQVPGGHNAPLTHPEGWLPHLARWLTP